MNPIRNAFALVLALLCAFTAPAGALAQSSFDAGAQPAWLARDRVFNGKIFLPANAAPLEREAAEFIATWFRKVAGVRPKIENEPLGDALAPGLYVGATRRAAARNIAAPPSRLAAAPAHGETWLWEPVANRALVLIGNSPLATRLAAGDFVQRHLGVTFLMPGEWGAEWLPVRTVRLPAQRVVCQPTFAWRFLSGVGDKPAQREWLLNNGIGSVPDFSHGLHRVFDAGTAREHPEFFPLIAGKRRLPSNRAGLEPQPNLALPAAATYAAERAGEFFRNNPTAALFSLAVNDNMTWDESDNTRALAPAGAHFRNRPDYSNYVFVFMNRVATALWPSAKGWDAQRWNCASAGGKDFQIPTSKSSKRNPPRYLSALAYADCLRVPDFPLHPNILPVIASDRSNWRDADFRDADSTLLTDWAASGVHTFGVYDYYHGHCFAIPRLFYDEQINSLRWAVSNRAALFYAEVYPDWGFDGAKAWLAARLALDSGQNSALLLRDYFNEAYGPAGEPMRLFHDIVEQCWRENAGSPRWLKFWRSENVGELISPENRQRLRDALARAERAFDEAAAVAAGERYASLDNIGFPFLRTAPNRARNPLQDSERLIRQHVRVRMASLAFGAADAFLEWHQLRASLLRRQPPQTAGDARKAWELLKTEPALRRRMLDAVKRWNNADINPGNPRNPADYFGAGIGATVTERLLAACGAALRRGEDAEWRTFYRDLAREAPALGLAPLVVAAQEPRRLTWLLHERFSHADFAPPPAGSRLAAHPHLTLPAGKWRVNVADCADVEIASHSTETAGENALCVTGASLAEFERDAGGIAPNARVLVKARVCGHISVGGSVTLQIRYLNAKGRELTAHHSAVLLPCAMEDWREFACVGRAPAGAVFAKVALIIRNQDAGEGLAIAGLRVGTL